jgi:hypothetical protein
VFYHDDDALTDALAEARADVWARLGLAAKHWQRQLNDFRFLKTGAKTGAIAAIEPKLIPGGWLHFNSRPAFRKRNSVNGRRCESKQ